MAQGPEDPPKDLTRLGDWSDGSPAETLGTSTTEKPPADGSAFGDGSNEPTDLPPMAEEFAKDEAEPEPTLAPPDAMDEVSRESEATSAAGELSSEAATPFSVLIQGEFTPMEREKLVDLLHAEGTGIRAIELESQFEFGKVLVPRISEYVAIAIVQAFRSSPLRLEIGPSDSIFSTEETHQSQLVSRPSSHKVQAETTDNAAWAEGVELRVGPPPLDGNAIILGVISCSGALESFSVEAEQSREYQELLDNLTLSLKLRAGRRGATAVYEFRSRLERLASPSYYRLSVFGTLMGPNRRTPQHDA